MNKLPLNGTQKQLMRANAEVLEKLNKQIKLLSELRATHRTLGGSGSKNLNVGIKYLKAFKEEVARGDYNRAAIAVVLKEVPFVSTDGSTPAYPDSAN